MKLRSRIVGFEPVVSPDQLLANPLNFRRHPGEQLEALRGSLRTLGWVKPVLVNTKTGHVVDGHARIEEALRQGVTVPVLYLDLSPEEEKLALAALDPITEMAVRDEDALALLLADVQTDDPGLTALLDEMRGLGAKIGEGLLPDLASGDKATLREVTFTLTDEQAEQVERAVQAAHGLGPYVETGNENSNGNGLARIAETFLSRGGK